MRSVVPITVLALSLAGCPELESDADTAAAEALDPPPSDTGAALGPACDELPPEVQASMDFSTVAVGGDRPHSVGTEIMWASLAVEVQDPDGDLSPWQVELWWDGAEAPWVSSLSPSVSTDPCAAFQAEWAWVGAVTEEGVLTHGAPYRVEVVARDASGNASAPQVLEGTVPDGS